MKSFSIPLMTIALLAIATILNAQGAFPSMKSVEPATAKVGAIVSVAGENLDKDNVVELFLTDNKSDFKVQITEQTNASIKFRVPDSIKPGRFALVVRTGGATPKDYVQPVKMTVE